MVWYYFLFIVLLLNNTINYLLGFISPFSHSSMLTIVLRTEIALQMSDGLCPAEEKLGGILLTRGLLEGSTLSARALVLGL